MLAGPDAGGRTAAAGGSPTIRFERFTFQASTSGGSIDIKNTSDSDIQRGYVLFEDTCADLGPVPAHATKRFDGRTRPFRSWQSGSALSAPPNRRGPVPAQPGVDIPRYPGQLGGPAESAFLAQGCLSRTLAMHPCLDQGAALVCVVFENAPIPINVKDRTYAVNHIQLGRLLVLPKRVVGSP